MHAVTGDHKSSQEFHHDHIFVHEFESPWRVLGLDHPSLVAQPNGRVLEAALLDVKVLDEAETRLPQHNHLDTKVMDTIIQNDEHEIGKLWPRAGGEKAILLQNTRRSLQLIISGHRGHGQTKPQDCRRTHTHSLSAANELSILSAKEDMRCVLFLASKRCPPTNSPPKASMRAKCAIWENNGDANYVGRGKHICPTRN